MHIDLYASSLRTYRLYGVHVYVHEKEKKEKIIIIKKKEKRKKKTCVLTYTYSVRSLFCGEERASIYTMGYNLFIEK